MKVKKIFFLPMLSLAAVISGSICFAQPPASLDLINNAKEYDNKTIEYKGEVIGDIMVRGDHAWLHVNDNIIAIGIWAPKAMSGDIHYAGDYHQKGDIVEVAGTFHRSCAEHGGDLDIHASEIKKVTSGSSINRPISRKKVYMGICLAILFLLFFAFKKLTASSTNLIFPN